MVITQDERRHISPSQINRFLAEPALWIIERFKGVYGNAGPAAWRGRAIEAAIDARYFDGANDAACLKKALALFDTEAMGETGEAVLTQRYMIETILPKLYPITDAFGKPVERQARIETVMPSGLLVLGYADWIWDGVGRDLKTASRMPSLDKGNNRIKDKRDHLRQVTLYAKARGIPFELIYASPAKTSLCMVYRPCSAELEQAWAEIIAAATAMEMIMHRDAEDGTIDGIAPMFPPRDLDSYLWSDKQQRDKAREIWGT